MNNIHEKTIVDLVRIFNCSPWELPTEAAKATARVAELEVTNANLLQANLDCNAWFGALNHDHQIALKALDELARLGAWTNYGNSTGNCIAQAAIAKMID